MLYKETMSCSPRINKINPKFELPKIVMNLADKFSKEIPIPEPKAEGLPTQFTDDYSTDIQTTTNNFDTDRTQKLNEINKLISEESISKYDLNINKRSINNQVPRTIPEVKSPTNSISQFSSSYNFNAFSSKQSTF
jgi:hypothetical protein